MQNKVYVGQPGLLLLDSYCRLLAEAYGPCYLVGECLYRRDYRHVDIRLILPDRQFDELFGAGRELRRKLLCLGLTQLLAHVSGLPIDFQVQSQTWSDTRFGSERREPIGLLD